MKAKLTFFVTLMVSTTLCIVVLSMSGVMLMGLFDEKREIFDVK